MKVRNLRFGYDQLCNTCNGSGWLTSMGDMYRPATKRERQAIGSRTARHTIECFTCKGSGIIEVRAKRDGTIYERPGSERRWP